MILAFATFAAFAPALSAVQGTAVGPDVVGSAIELPSNRRGLVALRQALLDATGDTRVLVVATHPDDTYRALCLQLRRLWGCDVTVLVATRGEGGQNAVGPEQGDDLARIRTSEAVRAAAELDVRISFLDFPDFGYSRSAEEALDIWRGERAFTRMRARLLELEPDLVVTIHGPDETHGQKQAVVELLGRVALDPGMRGCRFFRSVAKDKSERPDVELDFELANLSSGRSYRRDSYRILALHATQGPRPKFSDQNPLRRLRLRSFGQSRASSLFAGLPTLWDLLPPPKEALGSSAGFDPRALRRALEALPQAHAGWNTSATVTKRALACLEGLGHLESRLRLSKNARRRLLRRRSALERAVLISSLVAIDWVGGSAPAYLVGSEVVLPLRIRNGGPYEVFVDAIELDAPSGTRLTGASGALRLASGTKGKASPKLVLPKDFVVPKAGFDAVLSVAMRVRADAERDAVRIRATIARRILPEEVVTVRPVPESRYLVPERGGYVRMSLEVTKPKGLVVDAKLAMAGPPGVTYQAEVAEDPIPIRVRLDRDARRLRVPIRIGVPAWVRLPAQPRVLTFYLSEKGRRRASCRVEVESVDIRLPAGLRIGLVRGPDTTIEESLASLGLDVRELEPRSLARANLDDYDTIVIDSRALLRRREDLVPQIPRFLRYARRGKHLVVLYHKPREFERNELGALLAPYPLELGTQRVTREDAPVKMLLPEHTHLSWPNRLQRRDWDGWVQERGLYFPVKYDPKYEELLSLRELDMRDASSSQAELFEAQRSSLLAARVDRGSYVYCALVLHRQLRNLHPGAARLLVNLVTPPAWPELR